MAPLVLITGAAGLIGHSLLKTAPRWAPQWDVHGITRQDVDLTDAANLAGIVRSLKPLAIIHCAALSRTKDCEQDPPSARRINVEVTAHLAQLSQDIPFLFLSSGEVFDGKTGWYVEMDEPNPINVYGRTKLEAEQAVLQNPRHTVVRIVLTAGTSQNGDRSFVEEMCRSEGRQGHDALCRRISLPASRRCHRPSHLGISRSQAAGALSPGRERTALALGNR